MSSPSIRYSQRILETWIAFGGCPNINTFDGVHAAGTAQRLAEFVDPAGTGYSYSACTLNIVNTGSHPSRVISMPVDLMNIATNPDDPPQAMPARAQLLR